MASKPKVVGKVTHYYDNIQVGIVKLDRVLEVGTKVKFQGMTTEFEQVITDMQFDHKEIEKGKKGQEVGIKVDEKVRDGDTVYLVE